MASKASSAAVVAQNQQWPGRRERLIARHPEEQFFDRLLDERQADRRPIDADFIDRSLQLQQVGGKDLSEGHAGEHVGENQPAEHRTPGLPITAPLPDQDSRNGKKAAANQTVSRKFHTIRNWTKPNRSTVPRITLRERSR